MSDNPYLSLVVTARNDDHGGNLLGRMQAFINCWLKQARTYAIPSEIVIVEWNPLPDRPRLAEALRWPTDRGPCTVRIIEVSPELHARYAHARALPLYQMIGKNVGIRRARGRFVLATNIDILVSSELAAYLAEERLENRRMYRIDRHDVMSDVPVDGSAEEQLAYCRTHLVRINRREGSFDVTPTGEPALGATDVASRESGIVFGNGWFPAEHYGMQEAFRWASRQAEVLWSLPPAPGAELVLDLEPGAGCPDGVLDLSVSLSGNEVARVRVTARSHVRVQTDWPARGRLELAVSGELQPVYPDQRPLAFRLYRAAWEFGGGPAHGGMAVKVGRTSVLGYVMGLWRAFNYVVDKLSNGGPLVNFMVPVSPRLQRWSAVWSRHFGSARQEPAPKESARPAPLPADFLHTNACGDFTLLSREDWFDLRAYPEFDLFSMNLDSVFCFAAHYAGVREEVLPDPMRIYHIEHGSGSGWTPEGQAKLFRRIADVGLSFVDADTVIKWSEQMRKLDAPMIFNHEDWGLARFELPETVIEATLADAHC